MEVVAGPLPSVITKLGNLVAGEYNLQKGLKGEIRFLKGELESMQVAVEKVSNTLPDQLDKQDKIWARDLRELSYDIEDKIDTFMVRIKGNDPAELNGVKRFIDTSVKLFSKFRIRHGLGTEIRDTKMRLDEVSRRFQNFKIRNDVRAPVQIVDPRAFSQFKNVRELVGIHEAKEEVIKILMERNEVSKQQNKIVSIVGFGGLGKTTIAYAVCEELKTQFHCSAFVSVSQTRDTKKLLKEMLKQLGKQSEATSIPSIVKELTEFLQKKRYLIVVDDIWSLSFWNDIYSALPDNGFGNRIIITTRSVDVAEEAGGVYKLKPLSLNNSRKLFYGRVFGNESNEDIAKCPDMELAEVSDKILKKCGGLPLAIITIANLLAPKGRDKLKWYEVYNSMDTGLEKYNTGKIFTRHSRGIHEAKAETSLDEVLIPIEDDERTKDTAKRNEKNEQQRKGYMKWRLRFSFFGHCFLFALSFIPGLGEETSGQKWLRWGMMDVIVPSALLIVMIIIQIFYIDLEDISSDKKTVKRCKIVNLATISCSKIVDFAISQAPAGANVTVRGIAHAVAFLIDMVGAVYLYRNHSCYELDNI